MKKLDAFGQWVFKTMMFISSVIMIGFGIVYFVSGGPLLVNEAIPLIALLGICAFPMGVLTGMGAITFIIDTEKELEPTEHEKYLKKYSAE